MWAVSCVLSMYVSCVLSRSFMSDSLRPHGLYRFLCPWWFCRQEYWSRLPCPLPGDLPNPGIEHRSPSLQADSLVSEPPEKTINIGVGSLFLLQEIFPTRESNQDLLHCRQILYQLSYQGSPPHKLCNLILIVTLQGRCCHPYFTDDKTEVQRS